jgi:uncharacterized protein (DUF58 family)
MTRDESYKRLLSLPEMISRMKSRSFIPGYHKARIKTGGSDFERSAPFIPGEDDARKFAYRLSAKQGKPMKIIKSEKKENLFISLVAMNKSLSFGKNRTVREFAIELAGVIGFTALATDDRAQVSAIGIGRSFGRMSGSRNRNLFIARLMDLYDESYEHCEKDVVDEIESASWLLPPGSSVFIFSDWIFPSDPARPLAPLAQQAPYVRLGHIFEALSTRCEIGLMLLDDIRTKELPHSAFRLKSNGSAVVINGASIRAQKSLSDLCREREEWLDGLRRQYTNIDFCAIQTTDDILAYLPPLMAYFAERR